MTKDFYNEVYQVGHESEYDGGPDGIPERINILWQQTDSWLIDTSLKIKSDAKILEIGSGMSFLSKIHPGWHGAEYSSSAVERVKNRDGAHTLIFEEDVECLSFANEYFDGVFSWATLEHVPDPNKGFCEIDRVLQKGGYALLAPAWHCRPWTVKKLEARPWLELSFLEKLERLSIPIREHVVFRASLALFQRCWSEFSMWRAGNKEVSLRYRKLYPSWELIKQFGHVSDDDAVADIDSHAAILFFQSRGYKIISHPSFLHRMFARHEPVSVQKPL